MSFARRPLLMVCGALSLVLWPVFVHVAITTAHAPIAALLLIAVVAVLAVNVLRLGFVPVATTVLALTVLGAVHPSWTIQASPVFIYLVLAWLFGRTLRPGHKPMVSRFAELEQGSLSPDLSRYTWTLTRIWTAFFLTMASVSILLAATAPIEVWSLFTNLLSYVLVAALFLGELAWRHRRFPTLRHASPLELVRLIRQSGAMRHEPPARP